jgi:Spy/CpxP family protein refolding chaperone
MVAPRRVHTPEENSMKKLVVSLFVLGAVAFSASTASARPWGWDHHHHQHCGWTHHHHWCR